MTKQMEIALREHDGGSGISEPRRGPRLTCRWYKDADGKLVMRWLVEAEPDERRLHDALAA